MVMLLDYPISLLYLYKKIYSNHNRPPCTLPKFRCKESPFFWAGLLIISTDLFWHLGQLPIKLITDFEMSLSRSMEHDPIFVLLSALAFTFTNSPNLLVFSLKDLWNFDAENEMFTLVSVLFIPWSAVSLCVFKFTCWFLLNNRLLNTPTDELLLNLAPCLTNWFSHCYYNSYTFFIN